MRMKNCTHEVKTFNLLGAIISLARFSRTTTSIHIDCDANFQATHMKELIHQNLPECSHSELYVCAMLICNKWCLISTSLPKSTQTSDFTNSISIVL